MSLLSHWFLVTLSKSLRAETPSNPLTKGKFDAYGGIKTLSLIHI